MVRYIASSPRDIASPLPHYYDLAKITIANKARKLKIDWKFLINCRERQNDTPHRATNIYKFLRE